jgi:integrase
VNRIQHVEQLVDQLNESNHSITVEDIIEELNKSIEQTDFFSFFTREINRYKDNGKAKHAQKLSGIYQKLQEFVGQEKLSFDLIDVKFIQDFETFLISKKGNSGTTIHGNMKLLRQAFKEAEKRGVGTIRDQGVYDLKFKLDSTQREKLTEEELQKLKDLDLETGTGMYIAKYAFLFSYYCAGIRFGDLASLKWENVKKEEDKYYLRYKMSKTGKYQVIRLHQQAVVILLLMTPDSGKWIPENYIFPFLSNRTKFKSNAEKLQAISSKNAMLNKQLKKLDKLAGIGKNLSFHMARHSFAYIGYKKTKDINAMRDLLKHTNLKETQTYITSLTNDQDRDILGEIFD